MDEKTAKSHLLHFADLGTNTFRVQFTVPRPERSGAQFEKLLCQEYTHGQSIPSSPRCSGMEMERSERASSS